MVDRSLILDDTPKASTHAELGRPSTRGCKGPVWYRNSILSARMLGIPGSRMAGSLASQTGIAIASIALIALIRGMACRDQAFEACELLLTRQSGPVRGALDYLQ